MTRFLYCVVVAALVAASVLVIAGAGIEAAPPEQAKTMQAVSQSRGLRAEAPDAARTPPPVTDEVLLSIEAPTGAPIFGATVALVTRSGDGVTASDVRWHSDEEGVVLLKHTQEHDERGLINRLLIRAPGYQAAWGGDIARKIGPHSWVAVMAFAATVQVRAVSISGLPMPGVMVSAAAAALPSDLPLKDGMQATPGSSGVHFAVTGRDGVAVLDQLCTGQRYHLGVCGSDTVLTGTGETAATIHTPEARTYDVEIECAAVIASVMDLGGLMAIHWRAEAARELVSDGVAVGATLPIRVSLKKRWPTCTVFLALCHGPDLRNGWTGTLVGSQDGKNVWRGPVTLLPPSCITAPHQVQLGNQPAAVGSVLVKVVDPSGTELNGLAFLGRRIGSKSRIAGHSGVVTELAPGSYLIDLIGVSGLKSCFSQQSVDVVAGQQHIVEVRSQKVLREVVIEVRLPDGSAPKYAIVELSVGSDVRGIRSLRPQHIKTWMPPGPASVTARVYGYAAVTAHLDITEVSSNMIRLNLHDAFDGWDTSGGK